MRRHRHHSETDVQIGKVGLNDFFLSSLVALGVFLLLKIWEYPFLPPSVWPEAAAAAGVRPPETILPGYFTFAARILFNLFGIGGGNWILRTAGHVALAGLAVMVYLVICQVLNLMRRLRRTATLRQRFVTQIASVTATIAFVLSDPVWNAGQCLSPVTIQLCLVMSSLVFFFGFLRKGTLRWAYLTALMLGFLTAETPLGLILTVVLVALNFFVIRVRPSIDSPFFKPAVIQVGKWYMTFVYAAAVLVGVGIECYSYVSTGGLAAAGDSFGALPLQYLVAYWGLLPKAVAKSGAILLAGVCVVPFLVEMLRFPQAADEEKFLPYGTGIAFLVCGFVAFLQFSPVSATWFWTYVPVKSDIVLAIGLLLCAISVSLAIAVMGVDVMCRDHERLATQFFGADSDRDVRGLRVTRFSRLLGYLLLVSIPVGLVAVIVPGRQKTTMRDMMHLIEDAVRAVVIEADGARYLFSDGNLDAAIELEAAHLSQPLRCYALIGGGRHAQYLRTRALGDHVEDRYSFSQDAATGLRSWIRGRPERLAQSAVLVGFDLWRRDGKPLPPLGGMLSRPLGGSETVRREGVARAHALCRRALDIVARGGLSDCTWPCVKLAYCDVLWRLARMCRHRAAAADYAGRVEEAVAEVALETELNRHNLTFKKLQAAMARRNEQMMSRLTPLEGLQLALVRADFTMSKQYADVIIVSDPENPDANFAMGMYYMKARQFSRAEAYLTRCLIRKPNEPAVYNNLAMVQIELGKLDAAERNVEKALAILPGSAAVLDTRKAVKAAREKASAAPKKVSKP